MDINKMTINEIFTMNNKHRYNQNMNIREFMIQTNRELIKHPKVSNKFKLKHCSIYNTVLFYAILFKISHFALQSSTLFKIYGQLTAQNTKRVSIRDRTIFSFPWLWSKELHLMLSNKKTKHANIAMFLSKHSNIITFLFYASKVTGNVLSELFFMKYNVSWHVVKEMRIAKSLYFTTNKTSQCVQRIYKTKVSIMRPLYFTTNETNQSVFSLERRKQFRGIKC